MMVDFGQSFQDMITLLREMIGQIDEIAPAVNKAIGQDRLKIPGEISTEGTSGSVVQVRFAAWQELARCSPRRGGVRLKKGRWFADSGE